MFNHNRGLWGYTGTAADGAPLTIQSTGMGGPSAAIVIEELVRLGARRLVRVGTCGALVGGFALGDVIVASEAVCTDGTSRALGAGERVAADPALTAALDGRRRARAAGRARAPSSRPISSSPPTAPTPVRSPIPPVLRSRSRWRRRHSSSWRHCAACRPGACWPSATCSAPPADGSTARRSSRPRSGSAGSPPPRSHSRARQAADLLARCSRAARLLGGGRARAAWRARAPRRGRPARPRGAGLARAGRRAPRAAARAQTTGPRSP